MDGGFNSQCELMCDDVTKGRNDKWPLVALWSRPISDLTITLSGRQVPYNKSGPRNQKSYNGKRFVCFFNFYVCCCPFPRMYKQAKIY